MGIFMDDCFALLFVNGGWMFVNCALTFVITFVGVIVSNVLTFVNTFFNDFFLRFFGLSAGI